MVKKILENRLTIKAVILLVADGLFFGLINPNTANSTLLLVGFILFGLSLYLLIEAIFLILRKIGIEVKRSKKITGYIVIPVCLLLALQSLGQLSVFDILIVIPLVVLLYIYTTYIRPKTLS